MGRCWRVPNRGKLIGCSSLAICSATAKLYLCFLWSLSLCSTACTSSSTSGNHTPGTGSATGWANSHIRMGLPLTLWITSADSDCIHWLVCTASLISLLFVPYGWCYVTSQNANESRSSGSSQEDYNFTTSEQLLYVCMSTWQQSPRCTQNISLRTWVLKH